VGLETRGVSDGVGSRYFGPNRARTRVCFFGTQVRTGACTSSRPLIPLFFFYFQQLSRLPVVDRDFPLLGLSMPRSLSSIITFQLVSFASILERPQSTGNFWPGLGNAFSLVTCGQS